MVWCWSRTLTVSANKTQIISAERLERIVVMKGFGGE